jgi:hypothetical protein
MKITLSRVIGRYVDSERPDLGTSANFPLGGYDRMTRG